jgi:hypothetical protein
MFLVENVVAEVVAGQLTKAGIRTRVGWGNTTWDADGTLGPLFRSGNAQANYNVAAERQVAS